MKRRSLLATLAATASTAVAGCTGYDAGGDATDDRATTTPESTTGEQSGDASGSEPSGSASDASSDTTTRTPGGFNYVIDEVRTPPAPVEQASMDVTVTRNFSMDHPAALRVSFTNTADRQREFMFGSLVPWDALVGERVDGDGALFLAPSSGIVPDAPTDGCWRATARIALPAVMRTATLDAGETVSTEFPVLATPDSEPCHPEGTYRFHDPGYLGEGWGFEVDLAPVAYGSSGQA